MVKQELSNYLEILAHIIRLPLDAIYAFGRNTSSFAGNVWQRSTKAMHS